MFATNLRLLRSLLGLTQEELAEQIGVTRRVISYYENGNGQPKADLLKKIAETYDITVDSLIGHRSLGELFGQARPKHDAIFWEG